MSAQYNAIVIGGGVAGAYAAWRMLRGDTSPQSPLPPDPANRSIALFEMSDRIGGRLESLVPPGMQNLRAEFGGMGYTSNDALVNAMVKKFNLASGPFPLGGPNNLIYVRGVHFTKAQATDPTIVPYRLAPNETGRVPMQLVVNAIESVFPGSSTWTQQQWDEATSRPYNGLDLNDLGFWNFLLMNMSNEAFSYAHDAIGHFFEVANWNCRQALPWFMGDGAAQYSTLIDGYDSLPKALAQDFTLAGGTTFMGTRVSSVRQMSTGPQGRSTMIVTTDTGDDFSAGIVVLAMPRRSLELIDADVLSEPAVLPLVQSVTGQRVMKVFCCYDEPWWAPLKITDGPSGTDLPVGNVWYFGPDSPTSDNSLLLASYNDTLDTSYWEGLSYGPPFAGRSSRADVDPLWSAQAASEAMVSEIQRQLTEVHQLNVPVPYSAAWMDWSNDPYGGAFNTWNVGVDADAVAAAMLQPNGSVPLYICGEAYSRDQGWVEGALDTAEQVVELIGVNPPS